MFSEGEELQHVHRYRILRLLSAAGGMGLIYQAEDLNLRGSTVVIKQSRCNDKTFLRQIAPNRSDKQLQQLAEVLREAFEREARLLFGLRHLALPRALNYFTTPDGNQFFVMEFIPGKDLDQLLKERQQRQQGLFPLAADARLDDAIARRAQLPAYRVQ